MLSHEELEQCFPYASDGNLIKYLPYFNENFGKYKINTKERVAAFLAQIAHESGSLRYVEEIADGSAYEYRKDLGNLEKEALEAAHANYSTTGKFYKGRGLIQITGYYNYRDCGKALGINLIKQPKLLILPNYAVESACWFWNTHNCNTLIDIGDFKEVTRKINGGYNGLKERETFYKNNLIVLKNK